MKYKAESPFYFSILLFNYHKKIKNVKIKDKNGVKTNPQKKGQIIPKGMLIGHVFLMYKLGSVGIKYS